MSEMLSLREALEALSAVESEEGVRVVYACESGSRAWGFASPDSDYDLRFLYVHHPRWYLSIAEKQRDVIERPIVAGLDISGWDLRKALCLYRRSNPPLMEWLLSPIVYLDRFGVAQKMRQLMAVYYSPTAATYHYLHLAEGNYRRYLQGEEVWLKKYFYVLRPLLAVLWIEQERGAVPTDFGLLLEEVDIRAEVREAIQALVEEKQRGAELRHGPHQPTLDEFIVAELERWQASGVHHRRPSAPLGPLDEVFLSALWEVWGAVVNEWGTE